MILNLAYANKDLYTSNQIKSRPINLLLCLNITSLDVKTFCHLVNALTSTYYNI